MKIVGESLRLSASDLVGFLNCRHLTRLDREAAHGERAKPPVWDDSSLELIRERGFRHEAAYIDHLSTEGLDVVALVDGDFDDEAVAATRAAMASGAEVIVQATLRTGRWIGRADVLRRVERPSDLGAWSYEVVDTKLARETKAGTVLQLCLYSELIADIQGVLPECMHVVPPWREFRPETWRLTDFMAYYRRVKGALERALVEAAANTYPEPNPHCDVCRWRQECDQVRRGDDHPSLIAGISKLQIIELREKGASTVEEIAKVALDWKPDRGSIQSYERVREQARVQVEGRTSGKLVHELLPVEPGFGFCRLPEPSDGDVFLDFEGDPFVGEHGLEYLTGYHFRDREGGWTYRGDWALNRDQEKAAFESFIDFAIAQWDRHPDFHIFHYGGYETGALKRLMGRYATREDELDRLLRGQRFVDLLGVVRQGLRASVESYSIKKLEPFYSFERDAALPDANLALQAVQISLELEEGEPSAADRDVVEAYNRDDCVSTRCLRDWLEDLRTSLVQAGLEVPRPELAQDEPTEGLAAWLERVAPLISQLTDGVPVDVAERTPTEQGRWLLANLLGWHRREAKAVWWEYFRLAAMSADELLDERAGLSGLEFVETVGGTAKCPVHRYRFPVQEVDLRPGKALKRIGGEALGSVADISLADRTIDIKKRKDTALLHPEAVFTHEHVSTKEMEESLIRLAEYVVANGIEGPGPLEAGRALLLRQLPTLSDGSAFRTGAETTLEAAVRAIGLLNPSCFPIQGPPGTGKTYTGSHMICELVRRGKKVGIVANSHAVIRNLLKRIIETADELGVDLQCIQKAAEPEAPAHRLSFARTADDVFDALDAGCMVAGGTAWLWARGDAIQSVDVLFVDEAAQMSLANVVAVASAAQTIVLLGDPQQLDQPMQGSHPEGTDKSALDHLLGGEQTIDEHQGLFLEATWRLHPDICAFTSELFYEGKLEPRPDLKNQAISDSAGIGSSGLRFLPVRHVGNQNCSPEEAEVIERLVKSILASGATWTNREGHVSPLELKHFRIIAPYNAQVLEIQRRLPDALVGTVDKFQGQEAPIAIYSVTTSSHADAPRGMEFLYSLNRLNVATSRARCVSILVASPGVFEAECRTPRQIQLANAFCRYIELAATLEPGVVGEQPQLTSAVVL